MGRAAPDLEAASVWDEVGGGVEVLASHLSTSLKAGSFESRERWGSPCCGDVSEVKSEGGPARLR